MRDLRPARNAMVTLDVTKRDCSLMVLKNLQFDRSRTTLPRVCAAGLLRHHTDVVRAPLPLAISNRRFCALIRVIRDIAFLMKALCQRRSRRRRWHHRHSQAACKVAPATRSRSHHLEAAPPLGPLWRQARAEQRRDQPNPVLSDIFADSVDTNGPLLLALDAALMEQAAASCRLES